jgi:iduronate 2-sulfatase
LPCLTSFAHDLAQDDRPNILFIAVDDLRPELNCYGREQIHSPNIDRLAAQGVLFEHAYCMVPTCGASRAALMSGIRPSRDRFVNYLTYAQKDAPDALPLHTHFKNSGYQTISLGKIFHHKDDHASGWSEPAWRSSKSGYQNKSAAQKAIARSKREWPNKRRHRAAPFESFEADDVDYPDGDCAARAVKYLEKFATEDAQQPFFLAVGFLKPHLPFNAPKKYWDLYDKSNISLPANYAIPTDVPKDAPHNSGELRAYAGIHPKDPVDEATALQLIHGYYACVSFTDAQVGRLLDTLKATGLDDNTIVVLWGDHGWQLGEHGMWNKHSCFETSLHAPLIISAPHRQDVEPGGRVASMAEFIDVYPTLCELAGLEAPSHLQGSSLLPVMQDPTLPGKAFAISRYRSGDSIIQNAVRYSEYTDRNGEFTGAMMFDHQQDPDENQNIFSDSDPRSEKLSETLKSNMGR